MTKIRILNKTFFTVLCLLFFSFSYSQQAKKEEIPLLHGAHHIGKRMDADMVRWRGYGLGQFIHWGVYSILGGDYNGKHYSDVGGAAEWIRSWKEVPHSVYDSLYKKFDPKAFNPKQWAAMAKQMGVKYVTFTTKHHDGFCMWPGKYTDYSVANTPYKKDIVKQVVDAYNAEGIDVYLYFSIMDWHNPDWRYDLKTKEDTIAFDRFKLFTKNQLTELLKNYPAIKGLWFDGTWDNSWKKSGAFSDSLDQYLKAIHPGLIIGSRLRADDFGNRHFDANHELMGDYEQGWERKIPKTFAETNGNDWDCVMTIPENGWGYAKKWLGHWKTTNELLEMLAQCVSLDGNFVINFGPGADGTFRPEEIKNAKEIGDWMKVNNTAIYNCEYAAWEKQDWGYYTKKTGENKVYMIVFNVPVSGSLKIKPVKKLEVDKAYLLTDPNKQLTMEKLDYGASFIHLPKDFKANKPFVIVLETKETNQNNEGPKAKT
jgi:alpha-L-fucosidase